MQVSRSSSTRSSVYYIHERIVNGGHGPQVGRVSDFCVSDFTLTHSYPSPLPPVPSPPPQRRWGLQILICLSRRGRKLVKGGGEGGEEAEEETGQGGLPWRLKRGKRLSAGPGKVRV